MKTFKDIRQQINDFATAEKPFFLVADFEAKHFYFYELDALFEENIYIDFPSYSNVSAIEHPTVHFEKNPISFEDYEQSFNKVKDHLHFGNSFLTNLTASTALTTDNNLEDIFYAAKAKYKILFKNEWVCFSPETFIQIENHQLVSHPMKGTIDASVEDAETVLIRDKKEMAEHYTIVDLIRNDMSMVAKNVRVEKFRYMDTIKTNTKTLLQTSSKIVADLDQSFNLADTIYNMLPAGSISGAPKIKTLDIIKEAETHTRGFYTGTAYYFDGKKLDSCVLIRFIEKTNEGLMYKSGGGITIHSRAKNEYQELIDKIYVPTI